MRISDIKKEKISEQILSFLYLSFPRAIFTSNIAQEIARDEEFIKKLLLDLNKKKLIKEIKKSPKGELYQRRSRWKMDEKIYSIYHHKQDLKNN